MSDSYKVYASKDYVDSKGLPEGGAPYQQLVTDGQGVARWEDKPFGEETTEVFVFQEQSVTMNVGSCPKGAYGTFADGLNGLEEGAKYKVVLDGNSYEVVCSKYSGMFDKQYRLGNVSIASGSESDNTGEPFYINVSDTSVNHLYVEGAALDDVHTVSISKIEETIKPLDPKYLPESVGGSIAVKLTLEENGNGAVADKTFEEVYAALKAHKHVIFYHVTDPGESYETERYWTLNDSSSESIKLYRIMVFYGEVIFEKIEWSNSDNITYEDCGAIYPETEAPA